LQAALSTASLQQTKERWGTALAARPSSTAPVCVLVAAVAPRMQHVSA
jgi:hypothetical protein